MSQPTPPQEVTAPAEEAAADPRSQATPVRVQPPEAAHDEVWSDPRPLNPEWDAPTWWDRLPAVWKRLGAAALALVVVGGVWAAKGFTRDPQAVPRVPVGTVVSVGSIQIRVDRAEWKAAPSNQAWSLSIVAQCRALADGNPQVPTTDLTQAVALGVPPHAGQATSVVASRVSVAFGVYGYGRGTFTDSLVPSRGWTPCVVNGQVPDTTAPVSPVRFVAFQMNYRSSNEVQAGGPHWIPDLARGVQLDVPAIVTD